ncbi:thioredoxin domain-containing protein [Flavobacterium yafengii]|uniref:thioredoxin domain-containing protein n=1 Tax=Flavobacterium yafengii TaxID=3041253 RepID=UPI0024A9838A|nr:thioredoxin domain-containing protein [Flavobacterium yafengii]MDI5898276.1 thioredoxin domain-containing protein [Flavobacterium yafengii]
MKFHSIFLAIIGFVVLSCNGQNSKEIKTIDSKTFAEKMAATPNPQILDVRTPEEFTSDHIDNAKNINWLGTTFVSDVEKLDKSQPVFVYCKSGGRSQKAAEKLNELGFKTIYQLDGGMLKWDAAGFNKPTDKIIGLSVSEYNKLLNSDKKVLINFYAEWCAPCKKMAPYILQMQKDLGDKVVIIRLDADKNKTLLSEMKISELPTLLLYDKAAVKWKHSGFISEDDLKKQLQ